MKAIILSILVSLSMINIAYAEAETKKVCVDKLGKDGQPTKDKAGKVQQTCKEIKVHKKLEGTKVPEKK
jgi:hypothetical protein